MYKNRVKNSNPDPESDSSEIIDDPRFHSPDEALERYRQIYDRKKDLHSGGQNDILTGERQFFPTQPAAPEPNDNASKEIEQWRQYERDVLAWRDRVLNVVNQLRSQLLDAYNQTTH